MSAYQKVTVSAKFSDVSTFSPSRDWLPDAYNPGSGTYKQLMYEILVPITAGRLIDLVSFVTVTQVIIKNKDSTNYITATFTSDAANIVRCAPGSFVALGTNLTVGSDLTLIANTAGCVCDLLIIGT